MQDSSHGDGVGACIGKTDLSVGLVHVCAQGCGAYLNLAIQVAGYEIRSGVGSRQYYKAVSVMESLVRTCGHPYDPVGHNCKANPLGTVPYRSTYIHDDAVLESLVSPFLTGCKCKQCE